MRDSCWRACISVLCMDIEHISHNNDIHHSNCTQHVYGYVYVFVVYTRMCECVCVCHLSRALYDYYVILVVN